MTLIMNDTSPMTPAFDRDKIFAILPELMETLSDDGTIDPARFHAMSDAYLGRFLNRLERFNEWLAERQPGDLDPVEVTRTIEQILAMPLRLSLATFSLPQFGNNDEMLDVHQRKRMRETEINAHQARVFAGEQLERHFDALVARDPEWESTVAPLRDIARMLNPREPGPRVSEEQLENAQHAFKVMQEKPRFGRIGYALHRRKAAPHMGEIAHFNIALANHYGFESPEDVYHFIQNVTPEALEQAEKTALPFSHIRNYQDLRDGKPENMPENGSPITWEEARGLLTDAFTRLNPEMGAIVERAFSESWVWPMDKKGFGSAATPGLPRSVDENGHPWLRTYFDGTLAGLITLAHEMGHLVALAYASEGQDLTHMMAPTALHETFSKLAELTVHDELARRRPDLVEEATWLEMQWINQRHNDLRHEVTKRDIYRHMLEHPGEALSYNTVKTISDRYDAMLHWRNMLEIIGEGMMYQEPMGEFSYTLGQYNAYNLHAARQRDGEGFGKRLADVMRAGNAMPLPEALAYLTGGVGAEPLSEAWFEGPAAQWREVYDGYRAIGDARRQAEMEALAAEEAEREAQRGQHGRWQVGERLRQIIGRGHGSHHNGI